MSRNPPRAIKPEISQIVPGERRERMPPTSHPERSSENLRKARETQQYLKVWTREETVQQEDVVERLMNVEHSRHKIVRQVIRPPQPGGGGGLGITIARARTLIERVAMRWETEDKERRGQWKAAAMRRLMIQIQNCQGRRGRANPEDPNSPVVWLEKPNHAALIRYEMHLADLQGTRAPLEVDLNVQVSESLVAVFSGYSLEKLKQLRDCAREKKRVANAYLLEHPEVTPETIVVEAVPGGIG